MACDCSYAVIFTFHAAQCIYSILFIRSVFLLFTCHKGIKPNVFMTAIFSRVCTENEETNQNKLDHTKKHKETAEEYSHTFYLNEVPFGWGNTISYVANRPAHWVLQYNQDWVVTSQNNLEKNPKSIYIVTIMGLVSTKHFQTWGWKMTTTLPRLHKMTACNDNYEIKSTFAVFQHLLHVN